MRVSDKKIRIRRDVPRPQLAVWHDFVGAASSMVADAQGRRGALEVGIRPVTERVAFTGPALTIECRPGDNAAALAALDWIHPGDVLVLANSGSTVAAIVGGHYAAMAKMRGAIAIVADGPGRDLDELDELQMPCFCRGSSPNGPFKTGPGSVGMPIAIGGVAIDTGDIVVGDIDGVVVVPQAILPAVAEQLKAVQEREQEAATSIAQGKVPPWLADKIAEIGIDYV